MPTIIDANVLIALFSRHADGGRDTRIQGLIEDSRKAGERLIVPSPALAEFAVKAKAAELDFITGQTLFHIVPFDAKAALECADLMRDWIETGIKKDRHKAKFDLQILAIAKVTGATRLVTNDASLRHRARQQAIQAIDILDLPIPDSARQTKLFPEKP